MQSTDTTIKTTEALESSDKDIKVVWIKMFQQYKHAWNTQGGKKKVSAKKIKVSATNMLKTTKWELKIEK